MNRFRPLPITPHAMKMPRFAGYSAALLLCLTTGPVSAAVTTLARPDYQNLSSANAAVQAKNPAVNITAGGVVKPAATAPTNGADRLTECSFGEPFTPWGPDDGSWAHDLAASVRASVYGAPGLTRAQLLGSTFPFRYKRLLFSPEAGETDVTNHFQKIGDWYGQAERDAANAQIAVLRDAIAASPFNTGLRHLLLDIYYDLAVAEMQFANKKLAELATMRLGFVATGPFIIDTEIQAYEEMVAFVESVLDKYQELLSEAIEGVEPSDFDPDPAVKNMPMGYYIFIRGQKTRNATPSQYVDESGTDRTVPTVGTDPDGNGPQVPPVVSRPDNEVLFAGYKDYVTLLNILGRYVQYQADLARLRGMRQAAADLTKARAATTRMQKDIARDFITLKGMFPNETFLPGDASGVNAATNSVETALADVTNVRSFLNGKSNLLGLDPHFLLLVQDTSPPVGGPRDSFDVLKERLKGPNQPLTVALDLMATAEARYNTFRASVDRVTQELADVEDAHASRFREITGYDYGASPGYKGFANPAVTSELFTAEQTIAGLEDRRTLLLQLGGKLKEDADLADQAVQYSIQLRNEMLAASEKYRTDTNAIYLELGIVQGLAAVAGVAMDTTFEMLGADPAGAVLSGGGTLAGIAAAGGANALAQGAAAAEAVYADQRLDLAALAFDTATEKTDAELTVNMAKQNLGSLKRETNAHNLEVADTVSALIQAQAQRTALLNEVRRIEEDLQGNTAAVRSKYYADPIHYLRAEAALIEADEAFRTAQRWLFYTQRALEYKWQQRFAITQGSKSWDSGSIFKLRNARELDALLTQMVNWDLPRASEIQNSPVSATFISLLNDVLSPNPNVGNLTNTTDPGVRIDPATGQTVTQQQHFRLLLQKYRDANGFFRIPIDTVKLEDHNGNFFRGADYFADGSVAPGLWRDKIVSVKVNLIATDGTSVPQTFNASLTYGGNTFQRTRRPLKADRTRPNPATANPQIFDIGGEFTVAPFRLWTSNNFDNLFRSEDAQTTSITGAYTGATARTVTGEDVLADTFKNVAFAERSVAATRWILTINPDPRITVARIKDIELIIRHRYSDRAQPN